MSDQAGIPPESLGVPFDVRPLLQPLRDALVEVLTERSDATWRTATTLGWTVHDTVAHLLGDDLGRLARTRDDHPPPPPDDDEAYAAWLDRLNDDWVTAARRLSPRLLIELLGQTGVQVRALWAGVDLTELGEGVSWAGADPAPKWLDLARDYTEYWVHQAQIREAIDEPLLTEPRFVEPVVATFLRALPWTLRDHLPDEGETTLTIQVSDLSPGDWHLRGDAEKGWRFVTAVGHADTTVTWSSDTIWRVGCRNIDPAEARARATVDGDVDVAAAVCGLLAIVRQSA